MSSPFLSREDEIYWLALKLIPGLGTRTSGKLLDRFRTPQAIFRASRTELEAAGVHLGAPREGWSQLTPQELQVVLKVASGMANREVATQLFLGVKTVEFHLRNAFHKLGVKRRTQLAVLVAAKDPQALSSAAPR